MKVTVCIGSSCHIKGARQVVEYLQNHISENGLDDKVKQRSQRRICPDSCEPQKVFQIHSAPPYNCLTMQGVAPLTMWSIVNPLVSYHAVCVSIGFHSVGQ